MNKGKQIVREGYSLKKIISCNIARLMKDWKKPRLIKFSMSLILYLVLIALGKFVFHSEIPVWIYIFGGAAIKYYVLSDLFKLYLEKDLKKLVFIFRIPIFLAFIPITVMEQYLVRQLLPLIIAGNVINWDFWLKLAAIFLCSIIPSFLIVYHKYIDKIYPLAHIVSDCVVIPILFLSIYITNNIFAIKEDAFLVMILFVLFFLYYWIVKKIFTHKNCKEITEELGENAKIEKKFMSIPYLESTSKTNGTKEIKYRIHIFGSFISYIILLWNFSVSMDLNNGVNNLSSTYLITVISLYYYILLIRILIFNLFVVDKEDGKLIILTSSIVPVVTVMVTSLIYIDIQRSKGSNLDFASISMLLWILPKIIPTILDNLSLQIGYYQGKKNKVSIQYSALSAVANIFIYIFLLILLVLLRQDKNKITLEYLYTNTLYSFGFGLLLSMSLILIFSYILYQCKSLYDKTSIQSDQNAFQVTFVENLRENRSITNIVLSDLIINIVSIIISGLILFTLYYFSKSKPDKTFEIIKLSLPIFVPTFLDKIPCFVNYYLFPQGMKIKLTEKADYTKSIIDFNLFVIVAVLYVWNYMKEGPLSLLIILVVVVSIHIVAFLIRIFAFLIKNKTSKELT